MVQDQISLSGGARRRGLLSMAGSSVVAKKDHQLLDEESKLIEEYYRNYKQPKPNKGNRLNIQKRSHVRRVRDIDDLSDPGSRHSSHPRRVPNHQNPYQDSGEGVHELDEEEQAAIVARLEKKKNDIWIQIQRLPVCNRSPAVVQKEKDLYRELDDVTSNLLLMQNNRVLIA